jgi:hypothetical protein
VILEQKSFFVNFDPLILKIGNFGQNKSSIAEKLATSPLLYEEFEKIGSEKICGPPPQIPAREVFADIVS